MKVILTQNVQKLGKVGDIVKVADGYGRNFLIPKKMAVRANESNVKSFDHQKRVIEHRLKKDMESAKGILQKIEALKVQLTRRAGENDKLFGSVTNLDIQAEMAKLGVEVDRKAILLEQPIRTLGNHTVLVRVASTVEARLNVNVAADASEEAAASN